MTIGGRADVVASYLGWLDELQVATAALSATEIEAIALAGTGALCPPAATTMTVGVQSNIRYGSPSPPPRRCATAPGCRAREAGHDQSRYVSPTGAYVGEVSRTTDSAGRIQVQVPISRPPPRAPTTPG